jgi:hypothetical protein
MDLSATFYFAKATTVHAPDEVVAGRRVLKSLLDIPIPSGVRLAADIQGHFVGNQPSTRTFAAVAKMMFTYWGLSQWFDAAAYTAAHAEHTARGYFFDGVIQDPSTRKALLLKFATESDSLFDWPVDKAVVLVQPEAPGTADLTLGLLDVTSSGERRQLEVQRSDPRLVYNVITVRYRRNNSQPGAGVTTTGTVEQASLRGGPLLGPIADQRHGALNTSYEKLYALKDDESVRIFDARGKVYALDFVRSITMAKRLCQALLQRQCMPTEIVEVTTRRAALAVEKNDQLALTPI